MTHAANANERWTVDGKFFRQGPRRVECAAVTFGPFPGGWPQDLAEELARVAAAGFNAVRIYEMPDRRFLDAAASCGLKVVAGLAWQATADFFAQPKLLSRAHVALAESLREIGGHPALAAVLVGNEIPGDLVRWMGPTQVRVALEGLIDTGRAYAPDCLFGYANYPTTEYLELENANFTAMNVYLEDVADFRAYLRRLHHVAGDRPLWITEFGLDSRRNGVEKQARLLGQAIAAAHEGEAAGFTVYAWSDRWWNGRVVMDWDFGLIDRAGMAKPALGVCAEAFSECRLARESKGDGTSIGGGSQSHDCAYGDAFSVIVCTRNGRARIARCLAACMKLRGSNIEILVVDDGSTDGTADVVSSHFPEVKLLRLPPGGLSAARNAGAAAARGRVLAYTDDDCEPDAEWVLRLREGFRKHGERFAAMGGPNLPPPPQDAAQAIVSASPGAPSHVMLDDVEAEHLPGCNLAVTREALMAIGGFDVDFHTAGDDVDFCWRLRDAGLRLGFVAGAFVWHDRRPTVREFLRQQLGYGRAEAMLMAKHPGKFTRNGNARWQGFVYGGGPVRVTDGAVIYHGVMGMAGYQGLVGRMLPLRGLAPPFQTWRSRMVLAMVERVQPALRAWARNRHFAFPPRKPHGAAPLPSPDAELALTPIDGAGHEAYVQSCLAQGWKPGGVHDGWDLERDGVRLLFATERGDGEVKRVLVRVWGHGDLSPIKQLVYPRLRGGSR